MKTLLLLLASAFCTFGADLFISTTDMLASPATNRQVTLTMPYGVSLIGTNIIVPETRKGTTDITGTLTFTGLVEGNYNLSIFSTPIASLKLYVPNTNGTVTVSQCATNFIWPTNNLSPTLAYVNAHFATPAMVTNIHNALGGGTNAGGTLTLTTNGTLAGTIATTTTLTISTNGTTAGNVTL